METVTLSSEFVQGLGKYPIALDVTNKESQIFYFETDGDESLLLKYLYHLDDKILDNKVVTVCMLNKYVKDIDLPEFIIPKYLVSDNNSIVAFLLPEKKNSTPLGTLLKSQEISKREKFELVKKVGDLVQKTEKFEEFGVSFYFSDLHENNFLVDNDTKELFVVDLDSASFRSDIALTSYYLIDNPNLGEFSKYSFNVFGIPYPSHDNDLLCYNMMLLNVMADNNMNLVSITEYNNYLDFLQELGLSEELVDSFRKIYTDEPNVNASLFFDEISDEMLEEASYSKMKSNTRKI